MSDTRAVTIDELVRWNGRPTGQPLCPRCGVGRLHPYEVSFGLGTRRLHGWTAVCVGNETYLRYWTEQNPSEEPYEAVAPSCGFTMNLQQD